MSKAAAVAKSKSRGKPRSLREAQSVPTVAQPPMATPDHTERELGRWVGIALPAAAIVLSVGVGVVASVGPAILILAAGTLLGCIALLWASVRTLSGDAPLPEDLEALAARKHSVDDVAERKGTVLRALKDLEHEHAIGKIDDADYAEITRDYRERAKELMREMDADVAPLRARAEEIAAAYLAKRRTEEGAPPTTTAPDESEAAPAQKEHASARVACPDCTTSNEADAAFCKKCGRALAGADAKSAVDAGDSSDDDERDASA